jgi:hypothetical protein
MKKSVENYKKRFYLLMESEMGDVKPLISEDIFSSFIGRLAKTARKLVLMSEGDIINAFRTTESALGKEIDDLVSNVMKTKKLADIETLEAKLVEIFDPSHKNPKMAQEQTEKFLNGFAKSKNKTGWGQIRDEVKGTYNSDHARIINIFDEFGNIKTKEDLKTFFTLHKNKLKIDPNNIPTNMKNASNPTDLNYYITNYILPALEGQMKRDSKGDLRSALDFVSNKGIVGLEKYDLRNLIRGLK